VGAVWPAVVFGLPSPFNAVVSWVEACFAWDRALSMPALDGFFVNDEAAWVNACS